MRATDDCLCHRVLAAAIGAMALLAAVALLASTSATYAVTFIPDNGTGTVEILEMLNNEPAGGYSTPLGLPLVNEGLPEGVVLVGETTLHDLYGSSAPGGNLGGEITTFEGGTLSIHLTDAGTLGGFERFLDVPVTGEVHTGPRNPGDPVQTFLQEMFRLEGELVGDPDFCVFRLRGGDFFGLPSPGETTLTQQPSGDFAVDSFFDVTYEIEVEGCPGGPLEGFAGLLTGNGTFTPNEVVMPGIDLYRTAGAEYDFGPNPIPADFFGPGSDPFDGAVALAGVPTGEPFTGNADTAIFRPGMARLPHLGSSDTIDVELVELNLVSTEPIRVTFQGQPDSFFDVYIELDPMMTSMPGVMTLVRDEPRLLDGELSVVPKFTFVDVDNPDNTFELSGMYVSLLELAEQVPWDFFANAELEIPPASISNRFFPLDNLDFHSSEFQLMLTMLKEQRIPGDANLDGQVTDADAAILASHWQQSGVGWQQGDFNGDGNVTDADAAILATHWQEGAGEAAAVPEPAVWALVASAILALLVWRRRTSC